MVNGNKRMYMRKLYYCLVAALLFFSVSCRQEEIVSVKPSSEAFEIYASIEGIDDEETRTYLSGNEVYWSSGDKIAVFYKNTLRKRFDVTPESIDSKNATFLLDEGYVQMGSNVKVSHNVAYYPFCNVTCAPDGSSYTLDNLTLPETQTYVSGSVGLGAFPMVAVTENTDDVNFRFKNICGVMQFQLRGSGFVKSVSIRGNRGEVLAGSAVVTVGYGKDPSISLSAEGTKEVTLDCGESGVELNETTPVSFFIALPPVQFEGGFTITVTDTWGGSKEYSTTKKNPIIRSKGLRMPAKEYIGVRPPQEGDYIDEYGVNHGQGIEIDGVVWAPVNCGYKAPTADSKGFPYGKLYQWGRKYGQGYSLEYDESEPIVSPAPVLLEIAQSEASANIFYKNESSLHDWLIDPNDALWNLGTEDNPLKTEYDPCPEGWRVPSNSELKGLSNNHSLWTTGTSNQSGYWFSGGVSYTSGVPQVFLPALGLRNYDGSSFHRCIDGGYYSSMPHKYRSVLLVVDCNKVGIYSGDRACGYSVRCVQDNSELIPVTSVTLNNSSLTLTVGKTVAVTAAISPSNANHKYAYWWSEDESIATVDSNGKITAVAEGTTTITAMAGMQTAECVVTVVAESTVDMSLSGTANSYIVSQKGAYKFKVVKGNSSESVGAVASAEVLWETFGTDVTPNVGDLVKNAVYSGGYITFQTADTFKEGNAVIAAKDASGNILWSWHIWLTDEPEGQEYYNNAGIMMDRNLGATSATPGDVGALGLLYQWGRKDPFLGSSSISSNTIAKSTIAWPSAVASGSATGTVDYVMSNPTIFVTGSSSSGNDWHYASHDNTLWTTSDKTKSIYDPCPSGWRVPDGGSNGIWSKALGSPSYFEGALLYDSTNEGMNFSGKFGSDQTIWYPASGYRYYYDGGLANVGDSGYYWSASPSSHNSYSLYFYYNGVVHPSSASTRASGRSVRCLQE